MDFKKHWKLNRNSKILDVGCAKGFMLNDFKKAIPGITVAGVDVSRYAINHSHSKVKKHLRVANAKNYHFLIIHLMQ